MKQYRVVQGAEKYQLQADSCAVDGSKLEFFISDERVAVFTWFDSLLVLPEDD